MNNGFTLYPSNRKQLSYANQTSSSFISKNTRTPRRTKEDFSSVIQSMSGNLQPADDNERTESEIPEKIVVAEIGEGQINIFDDNKQLFSSDQGDSKLAKHPSIEKVAEPREAPLLVSDYLQSKPRITHTKKNSINENFSQKKMINNKFMKARIK